jgi:protein required for attachment to host cells
MKPSNGTLVAGVYGEKLALFEHTGQQEISLSARPSPEIADRASGSADRISGEPSPDNDTQAEDGFGLGVTEVPSK